MESLAQTLMWLAYEADRADALPWPTKPADAPQSVAGPGKTEPEKPGPEKSIFWLCDRTPRRGQQTACSGVPSKNHWIRPQFIHWPSLTTAALASSLVLSGFISPAAWANSRWGTTVYVNTPSGYALNSRWGPGTTFGVHTKTRRGCPLELSGTRRNGWLQLTNGTWVAGNLVSSAPTERIACVSQTIRYVAVVNTPPNYALNVRTGPGTNFARVGQYLNGMRVPFTGRYSGSWTELTDGNWVDGTFLQFAQGQGPPRPITPEPLPQPVPDPNVVDLQRRLRQIGFLPANFVITGIYDETTQAAVREFQRVNGLPVTGIVDAATWRALYNATATPPPTTPPPTTPPPTTPPPTTPPPTTPPPTGGGRQMRVTTDGEGALVFDGPGPEYNLLRSLPDGTVVTTTGQVTGNWTELAGGGWVFSLWLQPI